MNDRIEDRLHDDLRDSVAGLGGPAFRAADVLRRGRAARRRRTAYAGGGAVAVVAALAIVAGLTLNRPDVVPDPAVSPSTAPPSATASPSASPTASPSPSTSPSAPAAPAQGLSTLTSDGRIVRPGAEPLRVPVSEDTRVVRADRVSGGWVVRTAGGGVTEPQATVFLSDRGELREFAPKLRGALTAFAPGGRSMASYAYPYLYVHELPGLALRERVDVRDHPRGNDVLGIWFTGGKVAMDWILIGDSAHSGAVAGLTVYDLDGDTAAGSARVRVLSVSADARTAVLGDWLDQRCVRIAPFGDRVTTPSRKACFTDREVGQAALSPDGAWTALSLTDANSSTGARETRVYRTADLAAGRTGTPVARQAGYLELTGWFGPAHLIAMEIDPPHRVYECSPSAKSCTQADVPDGATAVILDHTR